VHERELISIPIDDLEPVDPLTLPMPSRLPNAWMIVHAADLDAIQKRLASTGDDGILVVVEVNDDDPVVNEHARRWRMKHDPASLFDDPVKGSMILRTSTDAVRDQLLGYFEGYQVTVGSSLTDRDVRGLGLKLDWAARLS
jgi:hypothetical protein